MTRLVGVRRLIPGVKPLPNGPSSKKPFDIAPLEFIVTFIDSKLYMVDKFFMQWIRGVYEVGVVVKALRKWRP